MSTWHSIEVQYEGDHESSLQAEDGDGEDADDPVGEVQADDHRWRQGGSELENWQKKELKNKKRDLKNRKLKLNEKEKKRDLKNRKLKFMRCSIFQLCQWSKKAPED